MKQALYSILFLFVINTSANAQLTGCPFLDIANDTVHCGCTYLFADYFNTGASTTYKVEQIPYAPPYAFNTGTSVLVNIDDTWSADIPLPFTFCFFGVPHNQIVIGSNGIITFDSTVAGGFCNWDLTAGVPIPTPAWPMNSIMGPYQDIDPTYQGQIFYQLLGTAPCRTFEVSYYQVPYYGDPNSVSTGSCPNPLFATSQIVFYETTNAIDIYIQGKEVCTGWNDGLAIEGIQDATGTNGYAVPGRNNTVWTATIDAWRFTPTGPSLVNVGWYQGGNFLGAGDSIHVCQSKGTTMYTAQATYTSCWGGPDIIVSDSVYLSSGPTVQISITSMDATCVGCFDGSATVTAFGGTPPYTYHWYTNPEQTTPTASNLNPGTYVVCVYDSLGCAMCDTIQVMNNFTGITSHDNPANDVYIYPNPTTGNADFNFTLKTEEHVVIGIYDMTGKLVKEILNASQSGGKHTLPFDASSLAKGMYVYRFITDSELRIGRMIIQR